MQYAGAARRRQCARAGLSECTGRALALLQYKTVRSDGDKSGSVYTQGSAQHLQPPYTHSLRD